MLITNMIKLILGIWKNVYFIREEMTVYLTQISKTLFKS